MGNEESGYHSNIKPVPQKRKPATKFLGTDGNLKQFAGKFLSQVTLRPVIVTNKLHRMQGKMPIIDQKLQKHIAKYDNLIIHHCAIQITLINELNNIENYIIIPEYSDIISDLCERGENILTKKISFPISCCVASSIWDSYKPNMDEFIIQDEKQDDQDPFASLPKRVWESPEAEKQFIHSLLTENAEVYGRNYGYIDHAKKDKYLLDSTYIDIMLTFDKMYEELLFKNEEFMAKCILRKELLRIVIDEYVGLTPHHNITGFRVHQPFVKLKEHLYANNVREYKSQYEMCCSKLPENGMKRRLESVVGMKVCGKYFNFETVVYIGSNCNDGDAISYWPRLSRDDDGYIEDDIVGKIYRQN